MCAKPGIGVHSISSIFGNIHRCTDKEQGIGKQAEKIYQVQSVHMVGVAYQTVQL